MKTKDKAIWKFPYYDIEHGIDWDNIEKNYDWFREMKDIPQDHIWHAEGDVQIHTKQVCEQLIALPEFQELSEQDKHIMFTSALFHDVEKRSTTTEEEREGRICITAPKHAQRGEFTARQVLYKDIPTPFKIREEIAKLVRYHGVPLWKDDNLERTVVEVSMFISNYKVAMLSKADVLGRTCPDKENLLEKIEFYKMYADDLSCLHIAYHFKSWAARYEYFTKKTYIDYVPFETGKFHVVMMVGIPGSGKDFWIKDMFSDWPVVSLDDIRREMKIKPTDTKGNGRVIQEAKERCKVLMRKHENFVFNATNITKDMRGKWTNLFGEYGGMTRMLYVEVPYKKLLQQNYDRQYSVPKDVVDKLIGKLEIPTVKEAYNIMYQVI